MMIHCVCTRKRGRRDALAMKRQTAARIRAYLDFAWHGGRFCHGRAKRSLARYDRSLPSVASRSSNRRLPRVLGSSGLYDAAPISLLCQDVHVEGAEHLVLAPPGKIWMFSHLAASERGRQTVGVECSDTEPQLVFG